MPCASCAYHQDQSSGGVVATAIIPTLFAAAALILVSVWRKLKWTTEQYILIVGAVALAVLVGAIVSNEIVCKVCKR